MMNTANILHPVTNCYRKFKRLPCEMNEGKRKTLLRRITTPLLSDGTPTHENTPEIQQIAPKNAFNTKRYNAQTFARLQIGYAIYTPTFIFATRQLDDRFYWLDETIATAAKDIPGYAGEEAWKNASTGPTAQTAPPAP
ncbi:hypothetical protein PQQ52_05280 [Paraburkholderia sediminicola]|uniref:hypothetical protein n=1 Tax=Paraburkholderia sediminicola TaxID=458836 RepID=UPI0038B957AB